ncbi:MAG: cell wall-binding repeat-containing protein [Bacillota bacterium]
MRFRVKTLITLVIGLSLSVLLANGASALERTSGKDRYETAVEISQLGWDNAETVVLATGKDFPDSLAGGPLAYKYDAPILLTAPGVLTQVTKDEISRLKTKEVIILGGKSAVSLGIEKELKTLGVSFRRISGSDRFATAARISDELPSSQVYVVNGRNFPDALSVSSYAAIHQIPILLTEKDSVPAATEDVLDNFGAALAIGGKGVISDKALGQLPYAARFGGTDRFDTNYMSVKKWQPFEGWSGKAVVATGRNFADALSGSIYAAKNNAPIILVEQDKVPSRVSPLFQDFHDYTVLGGKAAISDGVIQTISLYHNPFPDVSDRDNPMFSKIGEPAISPGNGMTVTVDKIEMVPQDWYNEFRVTYTQANNTENAIDEAPFRLYYSDTDSVYQYDYYNKIQPGESVQKTYEFTFDKSQTPILLEYGEHVYDQEVPAQVSLKWVVK